MFALKIDLLLHTIILQTNIMLAFKDFGPLCDLVDGKRKFGNMIEVMNRVNVWIRDNNITPINCETIFSPYNDGTALKSNFHENKEMIQIIRIWFMSKN